LARRGWQTHRHARLPKALVRGCLVVEAEDAIWQKQLFHLRFDILGKLSEILGSAIITDLEISYRRKSSAPSSAVGAKSR